MVTNWVLFVAGRMLRTGRSRKGGAALLAVLGIAAGTATLIVVISVMNGFQGTTINNILELNSFHIRVETDLPVGTYVSNRELWDIDDRIGDELSSAIRAVVPLVEVQTIARGYWPEPQGIILRAVPSDWLRRDEGAAGQLSITGGTFDIEQPASVVLGVELARALGLRVGDTVSIAHMSQESIRPSEAYLTVTGLFRSGYLDIDRNWGILSLDTAAHTLQATDPVVFGMKIADRYAADRIGREVEDAITDSAFAAIPGLSIETWREYNRGIFGALRMEKTMMIFLVGLIFVVVAGSIYQLLRRSILERSDEIAIIRALGGGEREVRRVFVLEGWFIGVSGCVIGLAAGLFIAGNVNEIFALLELVTATLGGEGVRVFSPSYFYLEGIPLSVSIWEVILVAFGAVGIAVLAARIAAGAVIRIRPMELLRNE